MYLLENIFPYTVEIFNYIKNYGTDTVSRPTERNDNQITSSCAVSC